MLILIKKKKVKSRKIRIKGLCSFGKAKWFVSGRGEEEEVLRETVRGREGKGGERDER